MSQWNLSTAQLPLNDRVLYAFQAENMVIGMYYKGHYFPMFYTL